MPEERKKARGKALRWSEEDIEALAEVTPADIERAKVWWRTHAPPIAKDILDAEPVNDAAKTL